MGNRKNNRAVDAGNSASIALLFLRFPIPALAPFGQGPVLTMRSCDTPVRSPGITMLEGSNLRLPFGVP